VGVTTEFISVQVGYDTSVVFPVDQGLKYIESLRGCLILKSEGYGDDKIKTVHRFDKEIKVAFISRAEVEEMVVGQELLLRGKSDE
jgi:hypothetical protein